MDWGKSTSCLFLFVSLIRFSFPRILYNNNFDFVSVATPCHRKTQEIYLCVGSGLESVGSSLPFMDVGYLAYAIPYSSTSMSSRCQSSRRPDVSSVTIPYVMIFWCLVICLGALCFKVIPLGPQLDDLGFDREHYRELLGEVGFFTRVACSMQGLTYSRWGGIGDTRRWGNLECVCWQFHWIEGETHEYLISGMIMCLFYLTGWCLVTSKWARDDHFPY